MQRRAPFHLLVMCVGATMLNCGCLPRTMAPSVPKEMSASSVSYHKKDFDADVAAYKAKFSTSDWSSAEALRNQIAYKVMGDIENSYGMFEVKLTTNRAAIMTSSDAVQLGLAAATGVVGSVDVKDILAASLTAFQGTRTSFDKHYFQEKTTEALIAQMRASRRSLQARLMLNLGTRDVRSYPFEAAWMDLVQYYYAGTVPSALTELASKAGSDAQAAGIEVKEAAEQLTPATPKQAKQAVSIRDEYEKLNSAVNSGNQAVANKAIQTLRAILTKTGYRFDENATGQQLLELFRQAMSDAATDDDKLGKLSTAVEEAVSKD
jgi:hypothetical protein